ncbi:MAG: hypothetical protein EZS28_044794 [Streblomastix strix]|uniref:Uncharacterized protein n=1 Tax=Streblomastix strix TaxID=222440 RepID=A0A5J4TNX4_9EUKA|nr:MAG: hypothetical protein EZS28_044794 [Streblomastix strix]
MKRQMEKQTVEKLILQNYGEDQTVTSYLIPYCIESIATNKSGIHSFCYEIRQADFLDQWLDQIFDEAKQIKKDNKYEYESIPQQFEVPVIGFNSVKSLFETGGGTMTKDRSPYEYINNNNYATELDKTESFLRETFENKLKNKSISEAKYQEYLVEAAKLTTRRDQARSYNIQDTRIMIKLIDNLIKMMFKQKIDMLAMFSTSQCANAIKNSSAYEDFKINGDYNIEDTDKLINITMPYWSTKVESYIEQDQKMNKDSSNYVTIGDQDYFKELFEKQRCNFCNCMFTWKNRPTLDRINNELGNSKYNVLPCCLDCNKYKGN